MHFLMNAIFESLNVFFLISSSTKLNFDMFKITRLFSIKKNFCSPLFFYKCENYRCSKFKILNSFCGSNILLRIRLCSLFSAVLTVTEQEWMGFLKVHFLLFWCLMNQKDFFVVLRIYILINFAWYRFYQIYRCATWTLQKSSKPPSWGTKNSLTHTEHRMLNTVWISCFGSLLFFMTCFDQTNGEQASTNLIILFCREPNSVCWFIR